MTQTTSLDLGALAGARYDNNATAAPRKDGAGSDFMQAFRQAEAPSRRAASAPKADRPRPDAPDRPAPSERTKDAQPVDAAPHDQPAETAQAPAQPPAADKPAAPASDAQQAPPSDQPIAEQPQEPVAPQTPDAAQAAIALALATGVQFAQPVQTPQIQLEGEVKAMSGTVQQLPTTPVVATDAPDTAAQPVVAQAQVEPPAQAQQAAQAVQQAQAQQAAAAQAPAAAPTGAPAAVPSAAQQAQQAQTPAFLAQAQAALGPIQVKTGHDAPAQPIAPVIPVTSDATADATPKSAPATTNLAIELLDQVPDAPPVGSTTQATKLDDVADIETAFRVVTLPENPETDIALTDDADASTVPLLNGDRTAASPAAAAPEAKAPAAAPRPEDVMPQILKHAETLRAASQNSIKLQLYPEQLGKMEIKVSTHQGVISATLTADSPQVKNLLESQVAHLQRSFQELGLKVDKVEVTLASANMHFDASGQMDQGQTGQFAGQQQRPNSQGGIVGSGYDQWLGEEPQDEAYAELGNATAIDFVA